MEHVEPSRISVVVPASSVWFGSHLREKTIRAANLMRVASIFRVKQLFLLKDTSDEHVFAELKQVLEYLLLPPYLKKYVGLKSVLRYVGITPPLKTPLHTVSSDPLKSLGEPVRAAVVLKEVRDTALVDAGFENPIPLLTSHKKRVGQRIYVKIAEREVNNRLEFVAKEVDPLSINQYLQPTVTFKDLANWSWIEQNWFKIELTRRGKPWIELLKNPPAGEILVFLGNQNRDPSEILDIHFDAQVNLVPHQGVETIRTEEALLIALSQLIWI
jgi:predicted SPOUT superfamily RNA methylase MTH1